MDRVVPWDKLCALVFPVYPKAGDGRPPIDLEQMIRIHCLQQWFNLSDPSMEESLNDSVSMRGFAGIRFGARTGCASASSFLSLAFSPSNSFSRLASETSMPPNLARHL